MIGTKQANLSFSYYMKSPYALYGLNAPPSVAQRLKSLNWSLLILATLIGLIGATLLYGVADGSFSPWSGAHLMRLVFGPLSDTKTMRVSK